MQIFSVQDNNVGLLSQSVRTAEKLFDEWTATVRFQIWFTESALLRVSVDSTMQYWQCSH